MTQAEPTASEILKLLGIKRIIQVDDANTNTFEFNRIWEVCTAFNETQWSELGAEYQEAPPSIREITLRRLWADTLDENRPGLAHRILAIAGGLSPDQVEADSDFQRALSAFSKGAVTTLTLAEWRKRSQALRQDEERHGTLVLFDLNFERDFERTDLGLQLLQDYADVEGVFLGILSHSLEVEQEPEMWVAYGAAAKVPRERFIVLSKRRRDPNDLLDGFRRVALLKDIQAFTATCTRLLEHSIEKSKKEIAEINIYDFDQAVFRSSNQEGVWEGDTYFRLFNATLRREAQAQMRSSSDLQERITTIRSKFLAGAERVDQTFKRNVWRLRRAELYEDPAFINEHCLPLASGDIFQATKVNGKPATFVLVAPPCDLMVRNGGTRSHDSSLARMGFWMEVRSGVTQPKDSPTGDFCLEYFDQKDGSHAYVKVAAAHHVLLAALDLCALHTDGRAQLPASDKVEAALLLPNWQKRVRLLRKTWCKHLDTGGHTNLSGDLRGRLVPQPCIAVPVTVTVEGAAGDATLSFGIKRVGRLAPVLAEKLLRQVTAHLSRPALQHDLARETPEDLGKP